MCIRDRCIYRYFSPYSLRTKHTAFLQHLWGSLQRFRCALRTKHSEFRSAIAISYYFCFSTACCQGIKDTLAKFANAVPVDFYKFSYAYIDISVATLWERSIHFFSIFLPVFMEVFIFLSRPDTSNSRVDFLTDGSSPPDRIVTIRRDICSFPGSSTSGSKAYFLFKLHDHGMDDRETKEILSHVEQKVWPVSHLTQQDSTPLNTSQLVELNMLRAGTMVKSSAFAHCLIMELV